METFNFRQPNRKEKLPQLLPYSSLVPPRRIHNQSGWPVSPLCPVGDRPSWGIEYRLRERCARHLRESAHEYLYMLGVAYRWMGGFCRKGGKVGVALIRTETPRWLYKHLARTRIETLISRFQGGLLLQSCHIRWTRWPKYRLDLLSEKKRSVRRSQHMWIFLHWTGRNKSIGNLRFFDRFIVLGLGPLSIHTVHVFRLPVIRSKCWSTIQVFAIIQSGGWATSLFIVKDFESVSVLSGRQIDCSRWSDGDR